MILDIIIVGVFLLFAAIGMKKGFMASLIDMFRAILSLVLCIFLVPIVRKLLVENNHLYKDFLPEDELSTFIPKILENTFLSPITDLIVNTILFIVIFILVKWAIKIFAKMLSSRDKKSLVGGFDSFLGFLFGSIKGLIIISLGVSVMLPLIDILGFSSSIDGQALIESSYIANYIYNENPLWKLTV